MLTSNSQRIFGLDLLRSLAIVIVVVSHSCLLINETIPDFPFMPLPDGVDLFFVLSGYLIGGILIRMTEENRDFNTSMFRYFLQRRWLRTLPNYFLFLVINVFLIKFGLIKGELNQYFATYVVFFQNLFKPYDFLFWESWSLAVEEWFYVLFPVTLIVLFKFKKDLANIKQTLLVSILLFLILPLAYRIFQFAAAPEPADWNLYFRKLVLTRLDCIGFGLLGAYLQHYYHTYWIKSRFVAFIAGLVLMGVLLYDVFDYSSNPLFYYTFYFSLTGISVLLLLPLLSGLKSDAIYLKPIEIISKISYSTYLVHIPLFQIFYNTLQTSSAINSIGIYALYWFTVLAISALIYKYFEKPFMDLRTKKYMV